MQAECTEYPPQATCLVPPIHGSSVETETATTGGTVDGWVLLAIPVALVAGASLLKRGLRWGTK